MLLSLIVLFCGSWWCGLAWHINTGRWIWQTWSGACRCDVTRLCCKFPFESLPHQNTMCNSYSCLGTTLQWGLPQGTSPYWGLHKYPRLAVYSIPCSHFRGFQGNSRIAGEWYPGSQKLGKERPWIRFCLPSMRRDCGSHTFATSFFILIHT